MLRKKKGAVSALPMPGSPITGWIGLISLLVITVLISFDTLTGENGEVFPVGLYMIARIPLFAVLLWVGWRFARRHARSSIDF